MNPLFVPLQPSSLAHKKEGGFVPTVLPPPVASEAGAPGAESRALPSAPHDSQAAPTVELQRSGDRITGITLRCSCGQTIQLECQT